MTDTRSRQPDCLDAAMIAEFLDGRLDPRERERVERHLAECESCYEAFIGAAGADAELHAPGPARRGRRTVWYAAGLAAAAALALAVWTPLWLERWLSPRPELVELVAAVGADRAVAPRLTGGFAWAPPPSAARSAAGLPRVSPEVGIAIARIEQALARTRDARTLAAFGASRLLLGRPDEAVDAFEEATAADAGFAPHWTDLAAAYLARSESPDHAADLPRAVEAAEVAISLDPALAEAWFNLALALERLNLRAQAIAAWERAIELERDQGWAGEARRRLDALRQPGAGTARPDAQPLRERLADDVLARWAEATGTGAQALLADARALAADIASLSPDTFATDVVEAAIRADAAGGDRQATARRGHAAFARGRAAYRTDRFEEAAPEFAAAGRALGAIASPLAWSAEVHLAVVAYRQRDPPRALAILARVREDMGARPYAALHGRADWTHGLVAALAGDRRESAARYRSAVEALSAAAEPANEAFVRGLLATSYDAVGDPVRAWQERVAALAGSQREGLLLASAVAAARLDLPRAAAAFEDAAVAVARAGERPATLADALRVHATTLARLGDRARAEECLAEARGVAARRTGAAWDRINAEIDLAEATVADAAGAAGGTAAATRALAYFASAGAPSRLPEAYLQRARLLRLAGRPADAWTDLERGFDALDRQRQHIASGDDQATFGDVIRALVEAAVDLGADTDRTDAAFVLTERARARDLAAGDPPPPVTPADLSADVPDALTFASYVVGDRRSYVWIVRRGSVRFETLPVGRADVERRVRAVTPPRFDAPAAAALRAAFLDPVLAAAGPEDELAIVPDGALHVLPFAALPGRRGRFLVEEHALVLAPSATAWRRAALRLAAGSAGAGRAVALGNPAFDRELFRALPDLPYAGEEARAVAASYAPGASRALAGAAASRTAFLDALRTADVVHFAGHALANPLNPGESRLVVADPAGQTLTAREVRGVTGVRARLVALAACESTAGRMTRSDGPIGLARAFLAAGVPLVVASHWRLDDRASLALFTEFHAVFARTGDAAGALREAQRMMLASSDAAFRDPARWAGVVVVGGSARRSRVPSSPAGTGVDRP